MITYDFTIPAMVRAASSHYGEAQAIVDRDSNGDEIRLSFAELSSLVDRAGAATIAAGLRPGELAAIWAPNIHEWAVAALGVLAAGGVVVPVNTRFKGAEARYLLEKSGARILFTVRGFLGNDYPAMLTEACSEEGLGGLGSVILLRDSPQAPGSGGVAHWPIHSWEEFLARGEDIPGSEVDGRIAEIGPTSLSDVIFTSGTTGKPKGVMTTHFQTLRVFAEWADTVGLRPGDRYLVVNPFFHTFGYKAGLIASLLRGATVVPMATLDVQDLLETVERERITVLPGPPTLYSTILDHPERSKHDLSSLRLAVTGAAVVPVELIRRMGDELAFGTVLTAYGLTEATGTVTMCRRGDRAETVAGTSGRALSGTEVRVVDDSGYDVPQGRPGEVVVRGYNVMLGYFDEPEETAAAIDTDGWLHTGDIGVMDGDGNLKITDRKKDMFIVGGFNAYPAEIENTLMSYPGTSQVAVVGVADPRMGEVGMAFVVARPGSSIVPDEIIAWARERMANYKVPRYVRVVDALPLNASGKIMKQELRSVGIGEVGLG